MLFLHQIMGLKLKIANWILNSKLHSVTREKKVFNVDSAQTIGILWEYDQKESFDHIVTKLKNKDNLVSGLCYFPNKKVVIPAEITGFSSRQTNWFDIPNTELTEDFIHRKFDILIDLTGQKYFPMIYLTALSEAAFKIGYAGNKVNHFDWNIEFGQPPETSQLTEQILYYLKRINKTTIE